jgi:hypothetical protein
MEESRKGHQLRTKTRPLNQNLDLPKKKKNFITSSIHFQISCHPHPHPPQPGLVAHGSDPSTQ